MNNFRIKIENLLIEKKKIIVILFHNFKIASSKFKNCLRLILKQEIPQTDIYKINPKRKNKE